MGTVHPAPKNSVTFTEEELVMLANELMQGRPKHAALKSIGRLEVKPSQFDNYIRKNYRNMDSFYGQMGPHVHTLRSQGELKTLKPPARERKRNITPLIWGRGVRHARR